MTGDGVLLTIQDAARAALEARRGGPAVAVAQAVPGSGRLLVFEDGRVQGRLADPVLHGRALELARQALDDGAAASAPVEAAAGSVMLYAEPHQAVEDLVIVGAGHIAMPLARLGVTLGFRVVVLDDREAFATTERFPDAADVRRVDFSDPFDGLALGPRSYVVLVTRAHRYDYDCLRQLMEADRPLAYLGMVGSRRRVRATFESLQKAGVPRERLAAVHSPIGLDIGAETPEEIAVSIAAELVAVRRRVADGAGAPLVGKERVLERLVPRRPTTDDRGPSSVRGGSGEPGQVPTSSGTPGSRSAPEPTTQRAAPDAKAASPAGNARGKSAPATNEQRSSVIGHRSSLVEQSSTNDPEALVYAAVLDAIEAGEAAVLATVVAARGSTPRGTGSKMLIEADGRLVGTVGGGCGEGQVIMAARDVMETGTPQVVHVDLTDAIDGWSPAVCGGIMEVLLEPVDDR